MEARLVLGRFLLRPGCRLLSICLASCIGGLVCQVGRRRRMEARLVFCSFLLRLCFRCRLLSICLASYMGGIEGAEWKPAFSLAAFCFAVAFGVVLAPSASQVT